MNECIAFVIGLSARFYLYYAWIWKSSVSRCRYILCVENVYSSIASAEPVWVVCGWLCNDMISNATWTALEALPLIGQKSHSHISSLSNIHFANNAYRYMHCVCAEYTLPVVYNRKALPMSSPNIRTNDDALDRIRIRPQIPTDGRSGLERECSKCPERSDRRRGWWSSVHYLYVICMRPKGTTTTAVYHLDDDTEWVDLCCVGNNIGLDTFTAVTHHAHTHTLNSCKGIW